MRLKHIEIFHAVMRVRRLAPLLPVQLFLLAAHKAPLSRAARRLVKQLREAAEACLQPLNEAAS